VAVGLAIAARRRARGLRRAAALAPTAADEAAAWLQHPGSNAWAIVVSIAAFPLLGLGPIARAEFQAVLHKIRMFAAETTAAGPIEDKGALMSRALDEASALLDQSLLFARGGVAVAALVAAMLAWRFSPARARARLLGREPALEARRSVFGSIAACAAIAVAAAAFVAARPLRRENQLPWPPYDGGDRLMLTVSTPDLDGPDTLERAPVIHLTPQNVALDGREVDAETLEAILGTLRHNYGLLQPDVPFSGRVIVICQIDTPIERVSVALRSARRSGSSQPMFVFLRRQVTDRPLFGHRWRNVARAARATAVEDRRDAESGATIISTAKFATCAALSQEIVAARRAGRDAPSCSPPPTRRPDRAAATRPAPTASRTRAPRAPRRRPTRPPRGRRA
jgi:hypothetical protein